MRESRCPACPLSAVCLPGDLLLEQVTYYGAGGKSGYKFLRCGVVGDVFRVRVERMEIGARAWAEFFVSGVLAAIADAWFAN